MTRRPRIEHARPAVCRCSVCRGDRLAEIVVGIFAVVLVGGFLYLALVWALVTL